MPKRSLATVAKVSGTSIADLCSQPCKDWKIKLIAEQYPQGRDTIEPAAVEAIAASDLLLADRNHAVWPKGHDI